MVRRAYVLEELVAGGNRDSGGLRKKHDAPAFFFGELVGMVSGFVAEEFRTGLGLNNMILMGVMLQCRHLKVLP